MRAALLLCGLAIALAGGCAQILGFDEPSLVMQADARPAPDATVTFAVTISRSGDGGGRVRSSPPVLSCPETCSARFDLGTTLTLAATPNGGSRFSGWSGDCQGSMACQVTVDHDLA